MKTNRRDFIQKLTLAYGSILFIPACLGNDSHWRFFSEKQANIIIAFAEQIIPAGQYPGATDANVVNFIDKQLIGPYTRYQVEYLSGLVAIENSAQKIFEKLFAELKWEQQTAFMEQMEEGKLPKEFWTDVNQRSFFNLMLDHTMQGFYGSPRHGGNKNYVSYKMMKLDYPHVLGQNRYNSKCTNAKLMEL
jgi:gluconate 2-dehydrogenase gamma chain